MLRVEYTVKKESRDNQKRTIIDTRILRRNGDLFMKLGGEISTTNPSKEKIELSLDRQRKMLIGWINEAFAKSTKITSHEL